MIVKRVLAMAAIAMSFTGAQALSQSGASAQVPAEFPPASYSGRQYVDSNGCVFIRAGVDGQTTWVPRVSRSREVICGFQPSLATARAAPEPVPAPSAAPTARQAAAPEQAQTKARTAQPTAQSRATSTRTTATAQTQSVRRSEQTTRAPSPRAATPSDQQVATTAPSDQQVATTAPRPAASAPRVVRAAPATGQAACEGLSPVSAQYLRARPGMTVRCGPQAERAYTVISGGGGSGPAMRSVDGTPAPVIRSQAAPASARAAPNPAITPQTRVAPKHVYATQRNSHDGLRVPEGYKPVWEDDRLNPERGHQTFAGMAQSEVVWTRTVPRRLVNRITGREVTYRYPGLQYPYTSFEQQRAAGVTVATSGRVMQEPVRVTRSQDGQVQRVVQTRSSAPQATRPAPAAAPVVSTRSAPKQAGKATSHRYVQVGIFADAAHGKRAARALAQQGLPAKTGTLNRDGTAYTLVVAGPFDTQSALQAALSKTRAAGYSGAKLRK